MRRPGAARMEDVDTDAAHPDRHADPPVAGHDPGDTEPDPGQRQAESRQPPGPAPVGEPPVVRLADQLKPLPDAPFYLPEPSDDRIAQIDALLHEDPADPRTLRELGAVVGASERTLSRLFRAQTGMTFPQWRAQLRLHHAVRRLANGTPVTTVAHETGYANASAFVEAFRLATGTTPGAYQRGLS
jgi:AraC-like DNA-binding protein